VDVIGYAKCQRKYNNDVAYNMLEVIVLPLVVATVKETPNVNGK
jgi:hypothetical protein